MSQFGPEGLELQNTRAYTAAVRAQTAALTRPSAWVQQLADTFDVDHLAAEVVATVSESEYPDRRADASFEAMLRASVVENLHVLRELLAGRITEAEVVLRESLEFGRRVAQLHLPQATPHQSYRVGFLLIWDAWVRHLADGALAAGISLPEVVSQIERSTLLIFTHQDQALRAVTENYVKVEEALRSSREYLRHGIVRRLISDDVPLFTPSEMYDALSYDLSFSHVATYYPDETDPKRVTDLARSIRAACAAKSLAYTTDSGTTVVWFGRPKSWPADTMSQLCRALSASGCTVCTSTPIRGVAGIRETFVEVLDAARIRASWGPAAPRVLNYRDVRLEALLAVDPKVARQFVEVELGGLAEDSPGNAHIRETLLIWYATGSNVATAERLQLHEHTVRNRLRRAEMLIGHVITERRAEIQVALRLQRMLPSGGHPVEVQPTVR